MIRSVGFFRHSFQFPQPCLSRGGEVIGDLSGYGIGFRVGPAVKLELPQSFDYVKDRVLNGLHRFVPGFGAVEPAEYVGPDIVGYRSFADRHGLSSRSISGDFEDSGVPSDSSGGAL